MPQASKESNDHAQGEIMSARTNVSELLLEESPDASVILTTRGAIAHWTRGAQSVYGHTTKVAQGSDFAELVVPLDHLADHRQRFANTLSVGSATYESVRRRVDGSLLCCTSTSPANAF